MIPKLFDKSETAFTSNGLGRLSGCVRCIVTEERNGIFECEFDYPVTGVHFEDIQMGRIILCTHDEQGDVQPFDIYAKTEPINGIVTFYARHISYRLNEITVKPFTAGSCAEALSKIDSQSVTTNPFTFWTNKSVSATFMSETPRKARAMLGGEENSILDIYGTGEYEFDKFDVKLYLHRGQDTNVSIRYGKNLVDFNNDEDTSDVYTAIVPYWLGSETVGDESVTVLVTLPEWFLTSGHTVPSGREVIVPMDLSGEFSEKPSVSDLRTRAQSRLASSDGWLPNQTVTINFVQLWQTEEYKDYAPLQRLKLCDTCGVFVPMYNMSLRAKVIKVVYNVLLDRYDEMELGDKPTTYAAVLEKSFDSKVAGLEQGFQSIKIDIETVEQNAAADATQKANAAEQAAISAASTDATQKANAAQSAAISAAATDATQKANAAQSAAEATASADATAKANAAQSAAEATASADATAKANAAQSAAEATASADATAKANAAEAVAKGYADTEIASAKSTIESEYEQAIEDATELIRGGTGGYIVTTINANGQPIELLITDNLDLNQAVNIWRWNLGGLAHSSNGYNGPFTDVAITQDGKINASMIMTGILNANLIKAGTISDDSGLNYWNLATGQFVTKQGQIGSFGITSNAIQYTSQDQTVTATIDADGFATTKLGYAYKSGSKLSNGVLDLYSSDRNAGTLDRIMSIFADGVSSGYHRFVVRDVPASNYLINYRGDYQITDWGGELRVWGNLSVAGGGTKSREVDTENYGARRLYCYETPTPIFADIGEAVLDEDGLCYVDLDDIFSETLADNVEYQVFLQKEDEGDCWIADKVPRYFVIQGTPGLRVAWEIKAKQKKFETIRIEPANRNLDEYEHNTKTDDLFDNYITEQEELLYG